VSPRAVPAPLEEKEVAPGALQGVRVLDLTDLAGALCARLLADLGADVVKVEPPGGAPLRRLAPHEPGAADGEGGHAFWFHDHGKRSIVLDVATREGAERLRSLASRADVVVAARPPDLLGVAGIARDALLAAAPRMVLVEVTPFGATGPHAGWRGSDLVCAARGGMVFVNGHPDEPPIAPFGLQAYNSAGMFAAIGALCALHVRERTGRGAHVDVSIAAAAAGAVEHVTGFLRQTGAIERRRGTLHWSRYFQIGPCRDGFVLHSTIGDWTTLAEWVAGDGEAWDLRDPRWEEPAERKAHAEHLFACLTEWGRTHTVAELMEGAQLRRLPYAAVQQPEEIARDEQLHARGFPDPSSATAPGAPPLPGPAVLLSATPLRAGRRPPRLGEHEEEFRRDVAWSGPASPRAASAPPDAPGARPLDGTLVLDFTWVVAGPVATRTLADQGARVVKVERADALDFGSRRGGLTGNLNRGKESVVLNLADPRGLDLVRGLVRRADVVIDNYSARVMQNWRLDYPALKAIKPDVVAVAMPGFGLTGPRRDFVSYGPTLQALVGFPLLMRHAGGEPAGWGYSWSDMLAGMTAAYATLAALRHRDRTGEGQLVDVGQYGVLAALLGPALCTLLRGVPVEPPGNASQEGPAVPHGVYRCAAEPAADGSGAIDDDRWVAIAVLDDAAWSRLAAALAADGADWARAGELATLAGRRRAQAEVDARLGAWTRRRTASAVERRLQEAAVAAGVVANGADLAADPQLAHRGYFATVPTPEGGRETFDGVPFVTSTRAGRVAGPGPLLGEHTDLVLHDLLGLGEADIAALRAEGVIR
jgi:crotonobetainyl-CoA:carnitine CoA-transferase CaiB-like acyl-CoA transferase